MIPARLQCPACKLKFGIAHKTITLQGVTVNCSCGWTKFYPNKTKEEKPDKGDWSLIFIE